MKKRICLEVNCNSLIDIKERYCEKHKRPKVKLFENAVRYNAEFYNTVKWQNLKKEVLRNQSYCNRCGITNSIVQLDIHHKIPPKGNEELFFDIENCIPLCKTCHRIITAKEIHNFS